MVVCLDRYLSMIYNNSSSKTKHMDVLGEKLLELRTMQKEFEEEFGCPDIISSSKFFEVIIADALDHDLIAGFSGNRDGRDSEGGLYEYKHYKESSSNHTWTFNDFSENTIGELRSVRAVIFAHFNDSGDFPEFDWYYRVEGKVVSRFLKKTTPGIKNKRKMINVSPKQIETFMGVRKTFVKTRKNGKYLEFIGRFFSVIKKIESIVGTKSILTSNKIWEVLVAEKLGHTVITEQKQFDAKDKEGNLYEYKVSKGNSWNFEDISPKVLKKFREVKKIVLATIDKGNFEVTDIYEAEPAPIVELLNKKLEEKKIRYESRGGLRRLQVSLTLREIKKCGAKLVFHKRV